MPKSTQPKYPHPDGRKPQRVVDVINPAKESSNWGTRENDKWWGLVLSYDKNFRHLERCINYDKAMSDNNIKEAIKLRSEIYEEIDNAYIKFSEAINNGNPDTFIGGSSIRVYLNLVGEQIEEAKSSAQHPRELMEFALVKLSILVDLAKIYKNEMESICNEKSMLAQMGTVSFLSGTFIERFRGKYKDFPHTEYKGTQIGPFVNQIMNLPFIASPKDFKKVVGTGFHSPAPWGQGETEAYANYLESMAVMPFFSPNGSVGFNTILCAVFHDYLPVGFGTLPLPVHTNYHQQQAYWTARHDYGHCFNRVLKMKNNHPDFFNYCKNIYFGLFQEMQKGEIDEKTLKKELLVLFFMVYELGCSSISRNLIEKKIIERTRDIEEGSHCGDDFEAKSYAKNYITRKKLAKSERPEISQKDKEIMKRGINFLTVLETADFVKPLQDLGYSFPDDVNKRPWKAASGLRKGLLAIFEDFNQRHPDFFVEANRVVANHGPEDPIASISNANLVNPDAAEKFNKLLTIIYRKAVELRTASHDKAAGHAFGLYSTLQNKFQQYSKSEISNTEFKVACEEAINKARPELKKHRGWKLVLFNIGLAFLGLGIGYVAAGLVNLAVTGGKHFFFQCNTDSINKIARVENTIFEIAPAV